MQVCTVNGEGKGVFHTFGHGYELLNTIKNHDRKMLAIIMWYRITPG